jgi:hypothetical protein
VVVLWAQRFEQTESVAAKPSGGSTSPLEEHADFLLTLIVKQPDLTLDEIVAAMAKRGISGSRSAVWRFFERARLVIIDETCATTSMVRLRGRCLRGERLIGYARHGQWKTITFVAGLRHPDGRPLRVRRGHQWTDVVHSVPLPSDIRSLHCDLRRDRFRLAR